MCDHENREAAMVTVARNARGIPTVWCDPCLEPLVRALNDGGLATIASCCGHGLYPGWVMLRDGRTLFVAAPVEGQHAQDYMRAALGHDGTIRAEAAAQ